MICPIYELLSQNIHFIYIRPSEPYPESMAVFFDFVGPELGQLAKYKITILANYLKKTKMRLAEVTQIVFLKFCDNLFPPDEDLNLTALRLDADDLTLLLHKETLAKINCA